MRRCFKVMPVVFALAVMGCASQERAGSAPADAAGAEAEVAGGAAAEGSPPVLAAPTVADAVPGPEMQPPPDAAPPPVTQQRSRPASDPVDVRAEVSAAIDEATGTIRSSGGAPALPAFPGARVVSREVDTSHERWARRVEVELEVEKPFDEVRRFYADAISAEGWKVTGASESEDEAGWKLSSGASVASVEIERKGSGRVKVELERRDR